ncbi:hypothetical protein C8034_v009546 [Colletotrichum sidae]|uniref:Uncharacterized protein n=1 Tax=Colletotrichum sidae TaxID=1347389 RepID=A0A4R8T1S3_9PEZI|nr:hypothetical protein C8034_v009546 [Colletotrichum sidae]
MDIIESTRALSSEEAQIRPSLQRKAQCLFIALELRDLEELKLRCVEHVVLVDQDLIPDVVSMGIDSLVTYMDSNVDKFRPNSMIVDRGRRSVGLILDFNKNALFTRIEDSVFAALLIVIIFITFRFYRGAGTFSLS